MAHADQKLAIFRGLLKFKSNVQKIWGVLIFLSIVTTVEVVLGIIKPESLMTMFFWHETPELDLYHSNHSKSLLHCMGFYAHS